MESAKKTAGTLGTCFVLAAALLFAGCSSVEERQQETLGAVDSAVSGASGAVSLVRSNLQAAVQFSRTAVEGVQFFASDIMGRITKVQSGAALIREGVSGEQGQ